MKRFAGWMLVCLVCLAGKAFAGPDAETIVKESFDYWRGKASVSVTDMTIHRPQWERTMTIRAWTKGESDSLFIIISPVKDKGNGTLKIDRGMWMFNPKVNRVIKLPPSMMNQSWQGSDFSNNDLAKSDSLIHDYTYTLDSEEQHDNKKVYVVTAIPKPDAPVIWGMLTLKIREDHILLEEIFYDEDKKPVKIMTATDIRKVGDKPFPMRWMMKKADVDDEYTLLVYSELSFKDHLDERLFTLPSLKNRQYWD